MPGRMFAQIWIVQFVPTEIVACPRDLATGTREVGLTLPLLIIDPVLANTTTVLLGYASAFPFAVKLLTSFALGTLTLVCLRTSANAAGIVLRIPTTHTTTIVAANATTIAIVVFWRVHASGRRVSQRLVVIARSLVCALKHIANPCRQHWRKAGVLKFTVSSAPKCVPPLIIRFAECVVCDKHRHEAQ
jgi:hypothetical protein